MPRVSSAALAALFTLAAVATSPPSSAAGADWPAFGRDPGGSQHSPLATINTSA